VVVFWQDSRMFIELPAGRRLCYSAPRLISNRFGGTGVGYLAPGASGQLTLQETFGGKLVENVTQSIARDLLANAMTNLEAAGYPIVFHVHDEVVLETPFGEGSVEDACSIMHDVPAWAEGLPMRADGFVCRFYRKE
jgi:DNA polymerase